MKCLISFAFHLKFDMKYSGLTYLIAFVLALGIVIYQYSVYGTWLSPYLLIPVILGVTGYTLGPQIDWWFYKHFPPRLDDKVKRIFETNSEFYRNLPPARKALFDTRICLYIEDKEWQYVSMEDEMPYDIRAIIAFEPVRLTLNHENFLMRPFDRIAVYQNPFLSTFYPDRYHGSELYSDEGIALFSLKHIIPAFRQPLEYFNVVLYEYARIMIATHKNLNFPKLDENFWYDLYKVANYGHREIMGAIGLPDVDILPVAIHHYFVYGPYFRAIYPNLCEQLDLIFGSDIIPDQLPEGTII